MWGLWGKSGEVANQYSSINNKLPLNRAPITTSFLSFVNIKESEILNILKSLMLIRLMDTVIISIKIIKLPHKSILKPLKDLFENCLRSGIFPD